MEPTEKKCEKCGETFSCADEKNDDYKNYCGRCYKMMICEMNEDEERMEHWDF